MSAIFCQHVPAFFLLYEYCAAMEYLNSHWGMFFRPLFLLKLSTVYQHGLASARQQIGCVSTHSWGGVRSSATFSASNPPSVLCMLENAEVKLFHKIISNRHALQSFWRIGLMLATAYNLRSRKHNKTLIPKTVDLSHRDFLIRCLYKCSY